MKVLYEIVSFLKTYGEIFPNHMDAFRKVSK